jgi:hypothetical protein
VAVLVTGEVRDLAGNHLVDFYSEFTVESAVDLSGPQVASVRPQNGATAVSPEISVVLFFSEPVDPATVPEAVFIAEDGFLVTGTFTLSGQDQAATFVPDTPFAPGALAEVFVTSALADPAGNQLASLFYSSFQVAQDPATQAPSIVSFQPTCCAPVPVNTVFTARFSEPVDPATITTETVGVRSISTGLDIPGTRNLDTTGTLLTFVPDEDLPTGETIRTTFTTGITDLTGTPLASYRYFDVAIGSEADTEAPVVTEISPADGATGVGINAALKVRFSESVNALTVDETTIFVDDGTGTPLSGSISFADEDRLVSIVPHAPLAAATLYTVNISGLTDRASNEVVPLTTTFQTGFGPDVVRPQVVRASPVGADVPVNSVVVVEFSEPIDPGTVSAATFYVRNQTTGEYVSGSLSVDVTGRTAYFMPAEPFAVGTYHRLSVTTGIQDVAGNPLASYFYQSFTTAFSADETPPEVELVDPAAGAAAVPTNAQITVQMSEALDPISVTESAVLLEQGGAVVEGTLSLEDGNRRIRLVPTVPLAPLASHGLTVSELRDMAGNQMAAAVEVNFTTAAGADLVSPQVVGTNPSSGATEVVRTVVVRVEFSEPVNPMTVNESSVQLRNLATSHLPTG